MSRPVKKGLDYFPLDTVMDDRIGLIEAEFGLKGFAVVVKLFQKIYGEQGYYCEWTNDVALLFGQRCGLGGAAVSEIVNASVRRGIFDKDLLQKYQVLSSAGIQKRYIEACSRRKQIRIERRYLLLGADVLRDYADNNAINVYINAENADNNPQSKVKESKENKNTPSVSPPKETYGKEFSLVRLTEEEYGKLIERLGKDGAAEYIERLDGWLAEGHQKKNHYATILNWHRKDHPKAEPRGAYRKTKDVFMDEE